MIYCNGQYLNETIAESVELAKPNYQYLVEQYIRERYTLSDEIGLNRQRYTKTQEFNDYFMFCEMCKNKAKQELNIK